MLPSLLSVMCAAVMVGGGASTVPGAAQSKTSTVDLAQIQLIAPAKVTAGKTFVVTDEVENQGTSQAFQSVTGFYLSVNDTWENDQDLLVAARRVPQLVPTQTSSTQTPVTLKKEIPPGDYYLIAVADAKQDLEERTRGNNVRAIRITVLAPEPKK